MVNVHPEPRLQGMQCGLQSVKGLMRCTPKKLYVGQGPQYCICYATTDNCQSLITGTATYGQPLQLVQLDSWSLPGLSDLYAPRGSRLRLWRYTTV